MYTSEVCSLLCPIKVRFSKDVDNSRDDNNSDRLRKKVSPNNSAKVVKTSTRRDSQRAIKTAFERKKERNNSAVEKFAIRFV